MILDKLFLLLTTQYTDISYLFVQLNLVWFHNFKLLLTHQITTKG